jgi:hypothetical protein
MSDLNYLKEISEKYIQHNATHEYWLFVLIKALINNPSLSVKVAQAIVYEIVYGREGDGS